MAVYFIREFAAMRFGFALGNIGPIGTAKSVKAIAQLNEDLGYDRTLL